MDVFFFWLAVLFFVGAFGYAWYVKTYVNASLVKVPTGSVAWDGETVYPAGETHLPNHYQLIDIEERITTFGVDVMGLVSIVDTSSSESGSSAESGLNDKGPFSKNVSSDKSGNQRMTTRQATEFKYRYAIIWKPNVARIRQFVKAGDIDAKIAELLRTIPDLDMYSYADILGITIVRWETPKKRKDSGSVEIGDDVTIEY